MRSARALRVSFLRESSDFADGIGLLAHHAHKNFDDARVKLSFRAALEFGQGIRRAPAFLIGTVTGDGVVRICDGNNAGAQRNLFTLQTMRVPGTIEILVMVMDHLANTC